MSVRTTQTGAVPSLPSVVDRPAPIPAPAVPRSVPLPVSAPAASTPPPEAEPAHQESESRRALRQARHHRRQVSVACAVLVGLCLALTILVVTLASQRRSGPQGSLPAAAGAPGPSSALPSGSFAFITYRLGVAAPEGGHR